MPAKGSAGVRGFGQALTEYDETGLGSSQQKFFTRYASKEQLDRVEVASLVRRRFRETGVRKRLP